MTENRFLCFVLTEGIILVVLALFMLITPRITDFSFGFTFSTTLITYGGYKIITSFLSRNYERHFILNIIDSLILLICGILMFFLPVIDMSFIIAAIGIYFILQSLSSSAFVQQTKSIFGDSRLGYILSFTQLFFGIVLIVLLPTLWVSGVLVGLDFLISGFYLLNMYLSKKYL